MAYLHLNQLRKTYGSATVVKDLNLEVNRGDFVSILGPSGCGKTTTLRMLAGFIEPDGGTITVEGQRIDHLPIQRRGIAMVFQNYALFPHMSVFDNVAFGLKMHKVPKAEIRERVHSALDLVQLPLKGESYPKQLSGGQQQRVALARAVVMNPKILLLDEPLSNLDAKLRKDLRVELREIQRRAGITAIYVTHDLEEAFSLSEKVAVMNDGRLEQFDRPIDLFLRPATPFVADFVGHTNLIKGTVSRSASGPVLTSGSLTIRVQDMPATGDTAIIAVPTHLLTLSSEKIATTNCFSATVKNVTYLGADVQVAVGVESLTLHSVVKATKELMELSIGTEVFVGWRVEDAISIAANAGQ